LFQDYEQSTPSRIREQTPQQHFDRLYRLELDLESKLRSPEGGEPHAQYQAFLQYINNFKMENGLSSPSPGVSPLEFDNSDLQADPSEASSSAISTLGSPGENFFHHMQHSNFSGTGDPGPAEPGILQAPSRPFQLTMMEELWPQEPQYYGQSAET
jgi:hypothetical protein